MFLDLCDRALQLHGQLISKEQQLLQEEMMHQLQVMEKQLAPILDTNRKVSHTHYTHCTIVLQRLETTQSVASFSLRKRHAAISRAATASVIPSPTTI